MAICRAKEGELARWKECSEEHLHEPEQPTRPVDLRDDGVDIDLSSREKIKGALKYLQVNKAAGADSIAVQNGRRNQGRPKSRWVDGLNSDSLALGVRDWTHCAQDRQTCRDLLQHALTRYWFTKNCLSLIFRKINDFAHRFCT
jgi:hypothetical protein